ncbi:UPF0674 endoplasmic reticulum membrane protein [Yarrowia sp. C11]|nr:UPF0674 endoplasmic reticulum membrane protein [Yarrowia sp. C11]KAG5364685.1 UPF0674 endoplasmic reticulum membrane protein [Yarrowia sp. E02]
MMSQLLLLASVAVAAEFKEFDATKEKVDAVIGETKAALSEGTGTLTEKALAFINKIFVHQTEYSPEAWAALSIKDRLLHYDWSKEAFILAFIVFYVGLFYFGASLNKKKINGWVDANKAVLASQFHQVGANPVGVKDRKILVADTPSNFTTYATGRVNIDSLTAKSKLKTRQNILTLLFEYVFSFFMDAIPVPADEVTISLKINKSANVPDGIWAIVHKDAMRKAREDLYFLSLTKTSDSEKLPVSCVFMSENSELTEKLYNPALKELLTETAPFFRYLAITDLPAERPNKASEYEKSLVGATKTVVLKLNIPSGATDLAKTAQLLEAAVNLVDTAAKLNLRPEVAKKIRATRESEIKKIQKVADEERAEEEAEKRAAAKKEAETKAITSLSPEAQRKAEQKLREKEARKAQKKQTRKG